MDDPCPHGIPSWLCADQCPESLPPPVGPDAPAVDLSITPGARLALQCQVAGAVPEVLSRSEVLDVVEGAGRLERWVAGLRIRILAEFADRHPAGTVSPPPGAAESAAVPAQRWVPDEVGLTLGMSRLDALGEIAQAQRFVHVLPDTLAFLESGRIDLRRAEAIARATAVLPDELARDVESTVLPKAPDATLQLLRGRVRRAIARVDPDGEFRRHRAANTERRVSIRSLEDGMASLWFYGSAVEIEAAWQMADRLARSLGPEDARTLEQRRFDVAMQVLQGRLTVTDQSDVDAAVTDILARRSDDEPDDSETAADTGDTARAGDPGTAHGGTDGSEAGGSDGSDDAPSDRPPSGYRVPADVLADAVAEALSQRPDVHSVVRKPLIHIVVGLDTLLGDDKPAELVGHGPVNATTVRALAADGVWGRLITDPLSGTLLDLGRTSYTPSAGLDGHVRARDQVCRGPQCGRRIRDLDHHQDWVLDGNTAEPNLFGYCQHHHKLKDTPGWQVVAHPDRSLTWISPCGRRHTTEPFDYRPFTDQRPSGADSGAARAASTSPVDATEDAPPF